MGLCGRTGEGKKRNVGLGANIITTLKASQAREQSKNKRMGRHAQLQEERIHSQDHSFQAFYWQGLFGHFFGQVHQPAEWDKGKMRTVRGLLLCNVASSALLHYICKAGFQERGWPTEDREQYKISSLRRY